MFPVCLLSRPGHFNVNGCSDECPLLERTLTVPDRGEGRRCSALICVCIDKNAGINGHTHGAVNH